MVIGAGIFKSTPLAAAVDLTSDAEVLALWVFGGAMSLAGWRSASREAQAAFPDPGVDYFFLRKAYGAEAGFLFAWSRFAVIHTGSIGDARVQLRDLPRGDRGRRPLWQRGDRGRDDRRARGAKPRGIALRNRHATRVDVRRDRRAARRRRRGTLARDGGYCGRAERCGLSQRGSSATPAPAFSTISVGAALVYVFLAYGGWSDAATLSAEMRDRERGMRRALVLGMSVVTTLYLLVNWAFLRGLGRDAFVASNAPGADLMRNVLGVPGEIAIVAVVAVTSITSMNAIFIAGARTTYAAARDTESLFHLRHWHAERGTPYRAIVAISIVSLALVALGTYTRGGFATMVDYLSPVYWLFLTMSGVALFVLRRRYPDAERPFRVPLYPYVPLAFIASSIYVFWSSVAYVRTGAVVGVAVLAAGAVLLVVLRALARRR